MEVKFVGFIECTCSTYVYLDKAKDVKIWHHPDDVYPLAEVNCPTCKSLISCRITWDHVANFRQRGVKIRELNDKFKPITEEEISEFMDGFDGAFDQFFANQ